MSYGSSLLQLQILLMSPTFLFGDISFACSNFEEKTPGMAFLEGACKKKPEVL